MRGCRWGWLLTVLLAATAHAHVASNGFLAMSVDGDQVHGSIEIAVRDVELAIGTGAGPDGKVTWGALKGGERRLDEYLAQHLTMTAQGHACPVTLHSMQLNDRVDGTYVWLPFSASCAVAIESLSIHYTVLEGIDPSHRGLLTLTAGPVAQTGVLGGMAVDRAFAVHTPSAWRTFLEYLRAGVWHIWSGIDHLLFLLSLLLPAVLLRRGAHWEPVTQARPALISIVKVVTAFTIAHSITLTLAALDVVHLPSRLTESVIAASIIVAALNNIFPLVTEARARIAFAFGLLHGFGFASVLAEMGLPQSARLVSLLAFNLGIEAGQLAVVLVVMPLVYIMRASLFYRRALLPWGSAAIASLACVWLVQRAFLPAG
jgi:hypothetical protein